MPFFYNHNKKTDLNYLKPLYNTATVFAIAPAYNFNLKKFTYSTLYKVYSITTAIFYIGLYVYSLQGSIKYFYDKMYLAEIIVEILLHLTVLTTSLLSIFNSAFFKRKIWLEFLKKIQFFDIITKHLHTNKEKHFLILELFGQILLILVLIQNCFVWIKKQGFELYQYYIVETLEYVYLYIIVVLISNFALVIKYRFETFNRLLLNVFDCKRIKLRYIPYFKQNFKIMELEKRIFAFSLNETFSLLSDLVHLYNEIFGITILTYMGVALMGLLNAVAYLLVNESSTEDDTQVFVIFFVLTVFLLVRIIFYFYMKICLKYFELLTNLTQLKDFKSTKYNYLILFHFKTFISIIIFLNISP